MKTVAFDGLIEVSDSSREVRTKLKCTSYRCCQTFNDNNVRWVRERATDIPSIRRRKENNDKLLFLGTIHSSIDDPRERENGRSSRVSSERWWTDSEWENHRCQLMNETTVRKIRRWIRTRQRYLENNTNDEGEGMKESKTVSDSHQVIELASERNENRMWYSVSRWYTIRTDLANRQWVNIEEWQAN